jgi:hypothetical protein
MYDYIVLAGMSTPGEDKGKEPMEDPHPEKSTWEVGESSRCNRRRKVIPPGLSVFTFSWSEIYQPPVDPFLSIKRRKIKKTWKGGSQFFVDVKGSRPKARQRQALPPPPSHPRI